MENEHEIFEENLINNVNVMKMPTTVQNDDFFLFVVCLDHKEYHHKELKEIKQS